jgi:putative glycosyltransferase (TIGR04372 family)
MMPRRLWSACFLVYYFVAASGLRIVRAFGRGPGPGFRELTCFVRRSIYALKLLALMALRLGNAEKMVRMTYKLQADRDRLLRDPECAFYLTLPMLDAQQAERVVEVLTPLVGLGRAGAKCAGVRGLAYRQLGRYPEALADLVRCHQTLPKLSQLLGLDHNRAFLHGMNGDIEEARAAMCDQFGLPRTPTPGNQLARFLHDSLQGHLRSLGLRGSLGVFFGAYVNAVGHAVLDPFHFVNLFGSRFDHLVFVHPDLSWHTPATRVALSILDPHLEAVACTDRDLLSFCWRHLGELQYQNVTFLLHNYWTLNRLVFHARREAGHPLWHGRTYFRPSEKIVSRAEASCRRIGLDLSRPTVVVHAREHGYHELHGQSYRNTHVRNYVSALRRLLTLGYQVVRVGDHKMISLRNDVPGLVELPLSDGYHPVLDPYIIARCEFMISCQSGPCSYARVFGKPNLVVNAVYHYTLLPERQELIAFKQYREARSKRALSVEQIFEAGAHLFDHTQRFVEAGIEVEDMSAEEIDAALCEMLQWLKNPGRPETPAQREFRRLMDRFGRDGVPGSWLAGPLTDYVGYALPECRVSDAVAALRPGYLSLSAAIQGRAA